MKRHPSLEVFSRDHNVGLILGRKLEQASSQDEASRREAARSLLQYWNDELADHFVEEERLLIGLIPEFELSERMIQEHSAFSNSVACLAGSSIEPALLARTGNQLTDHIRWEERVLFPAIERTATAEQLRDLGLQTETVENRRSNSTWSPRRGELVKKRERSKSMCFPETLDGLLVF